MPLNKETETEIKVISFREVISISDQDEHYY